MHNSAHVSVCVGEWHLKYIMLPSVLLSFPLCCFRDIDKVDDLMQDITEQQELAQEISDAISKPVGFGEEFDEVGDILEKIILTGFYVIFSNMWFWTGSCYKHLTSDGPEVLLVSSRYSHRE